MGRSSRPTGMRPPRRVLLAATLVAVLVAGPLAGTAVADAAQPGNFESSLDEIRPPAEGISVEVLGGDTFLQVRAEPGVEVLVPGYDGEPYLRIRPDGVVEENVRSPAVYLNRSLDGSDPLPDRADTGAAPEWRPTGTLGRAAWHDHRVHWMLDLPPEPGRDGFVQAWSVPLVVNGQQVEVTGVLRYRPDAWGVAAGAALAGVAVAVAAVAAARRERSRILLLGAAALLALTLSWLELRVNPPDAGASLVPMAVCAAAVVLVALAPAIRRTWVDLAVVAILGGWALLRLEVLVRPVLPFPLPGIIDRVGTAAVLGAAVGVAVAAFRGPLPIDHDPEPGPAATG
jgi:hypothetical protein